MIMAMNTGRWRIRRRIGWIDWRDREGRGTGEGAKREERGVAGGYPSDVAVSAGSSVMAGKRKREKLTEP